MERDGDVSGDVDGDPELDAGQPRVYPTCPPAPSIWLPLMPMLYSKIWIDHLSNI
jgi:hypothetical protein